MVNNYDLSDLAVPEVTEEATYDLSDLAAAEPESVLEPSMAEQIPTSSMLQKAAIVGKHAAAGAIGAIPDTLTLPYNLASQLYGTLEETHPELMKYAQFMPGLNVLATQRKLYGKEIPSATEAVEKGLSKIVGETPEELKHIAKGAEFAGSLALPGGIAKGAAKLGKAGAAKALGAIGAISPAELAGAAGAGTVMSKMQEEGYGLPAAILGGIGTGATTTGALKAAKGLIKPPSETIGKILAFRAKPDPKLLQYEKKLDIKIPWNLKLDSDLAHMAANTYLDTIAASSKYKSQMKEAPQSMIDAVKNRIASISPDKLDKEVSSAQYREHLTETGKRLKEEADNLYERARSYLTPEDAIKPDNTIRAMDDIKAKILKSKVPSTDERFVLNKINDLEDALGLIKPLKLKLPFTDIRQQEEFLKKYGKELRPQPDINLDELASTRSSLMRDINYGEQIPRGAKGFIRGLVNSIEKDIETTGNKDFLNHWKAANQFYKSEIAEGVRSDLARSLQEGAFPKLAFSYMNSPKHIDELTRIAGTSSGAKQVMDSLKRSKLEQIVVDGVLNADGSLSYAKLANLFTKKSTDAPMLKSLLGDKKYQEFVKLGEVAQKYSAAGKEMAAPSKTAPRYADLLRIGTLIQNTLTGNLPIIATVGAEMGMANLLSRLVSNEKYVNAAVKAAEMRNVNRLKDMGKYQKEMRQIFLRQIYPTIREAQKTESE